MKNLMKAAFAAMLLFNVSFVFSQSTSIIGSWHAGNNRSIEFYSDGSFLEINNGVTRTGLYSRAGDGNVSLTYTPSGTTMTSSIANRVVLDGSNMTVYIGDSPLLFTRSGVVTTPLMTNTRTTTRISDGMTGAWYSSLGPNHSIEFFPDGSFLVVDNGMTRTGLYSRTGDGSLSLTYTPLGTTITTPVADRIILDGNNLTAYINGSPMLFSRTEVITSPIITNNLALERTVVTTPGLTGTWYSDGDHSIEFFSDGSFLERNDGIVSSGIYSTGSDGKLTLSYTSGTPRTVIHDNFALNGNSIVWYHDGTPMTWTRTETTTTVPIVTDSYAAPRKGININGMWHLSSNDDDIIEFRNDGTFRETRSDAVYTGTYSIGLDNRITLNYSTPSVNTVIYNDLNLIGNDLIWRSGDMEIRWSRGMSR